MFFAIVYGFTHNSQFTMQVEPTYFLDGAGRAISYDACDELYQIANGDDEMPGGHVAYYYCGTGSEVYSENEVRAWFENGEIEGDFQISEAHASAPWFDAPWVPVQDVFGDLRRFRAPAKLPVCTDADDDDETPLSHTDAGTLIREEDADWVIVPTQEAEATEPAGAEPVAEPEPELDLDSFCMVTAAEDPAEAASADRCATACRSELATVRQAFGANFEQEPGCESAFSITLRCADGTAAVADEGEAGADATRGPPSVRIEFFLPGLYPETQAPAMRVVVPHGAITSAQGESLHHTLTRAAIDGVGAPMVRKLVRTATERVDKYAARTARRWQGGGGGGGGGAGSCGTTAGSTKTKTQCHGAVPADVLPVGLCPDTNDDASHTSSYWTSAGRSNIDLGANLAYNQKLDPARVDPCLDPHAVLRQMQLRCGIDVLKVENVLRADLLAAFRERQCKMRAEGGGQCGKVDLACHGTPKQNVGSIVRRGLQVPGEDSGVGVRCGSTWGKGIYLSPSPAFAMGYSDGKLLLCAVLRGASVFKAQHGANHRSAGLRQGSSSHESPSGLEWVFFSSSQVLPCYVLHVRCASWGRYDTALPAQLSAAKTSTAALLAKQRHAGKLAGLGPAGAVTAAAGAVASAAGAAGGASGEWAQEDTRQRRARMRERAMKHFPFGYGPGSSFVVEDVADSSDDDDLLTYEAKAFQSRHHKAAHVPYTSFQHDRV